MLCLKMNITPHYVIFATLFRLLNTSPYLPPVVLVGSVPQQLLSLWFSPNLRSDHPTRMSTCLFLSSSRCLPSVTSTYFSLCQEIVLHKYKPVWFRSPITVVLKHNGTYTKWLTFCRQHFWMLGNFSFSFDFYLILTEFVQRWLG